MNNFGIIKTLLVLVVLLLSVRLFDIYTSDQKIDEILVTKTFAQEAEVNAEPAATAAAPEQKKAPGEAKKAAQESEDEEGFVSIEQVKTFTEEEVEILKRLAERRDKLLEWEEELKVKHSVLGLTEEKIDKKLEELRVLKKKVESALKEYRKEEDKKTQSLVKIYENMKPKEAAEIMARMKIENILPIVDKMKEKSAAEILAKMDPRVAKEITSRLTEIGRLQN